MSQIIKDILFLLFEKFQSDSKTLFSCLLVNRLWCETGIPILWRNPWRYDINYKMKSYLFAIIASYLPIDIKEFLISQGINFPQISSLLFNYLSFCRSIDVNIINSIIPIGSPLAHNQFLLQKEFYNILITTCSELKYLDMRSIKHQIFYLPEAKARLEPLYELTCDTSVDPTYFFGLARICENIQKLVIINTTKKVNHGVGKLIEAQENLKSFEWEDDFVGHYLKDPYEEILLALEKKANTLNHLKLFFEYIDDFEHILLQKVLPKFKKLKTLTLADDFVYFNEDQFKILVYHDIEILNIHYITINTASSIIENSGGYLKEILLFKECDSYYDFGNSFNEDSLNFIHKVGKHCPSIEYLTLAFPPTNEHITEFEKLLKICQKLKSLLFIFTADEIETPENILGNGAELFKALIRSAPTNLRELRFYCDFEFYFSLQELEEFLEEWRGRPSFSIFTTGQIYRKEDYKRLINKYKKYGVIKDFKSVPRDVVYY
ncbi:hypothetical protein C1645_873543 [Glomus cerebriforme]|uniref:F-box domain-containing protein n=1 Tax=Glomus cerebriforme TaxID=658196 RepID=A0A397T7P7_9GLOM|nr:hypothetical protein C1645_873543 [Glomus cerebriforme]